MGEKKCRTCKYWKVIEPGAEDWCECLRAQLVFEGDNYPDHSLFVEGRLGAKLVTRQDHLCSEWVETERLIFE